MIVEVIIPPVSRATFISGDPHKRTPATVIGLLIYTFIALLVLSACSHTILHEPALIPLIQHRL